VERERTDWRDREYRNPFAGGYLPVPDSNSIERHVSADRKRLGRKDLAVLMLAGAHRAVRGKAAEH